MDPYKVLGVLPTSSKDEIKEAYRHIVETYNTDNIEDESIEDSYKEKLNEVNEAYRLVNNNLICEEVRDLIDCDDFIAAETKLNLASDFSSAEWNYLNGLILLQKGWIDSGVNHIKQAVNLNPYNTEYTDTLNKLNQKVGSYKSNFNNVNNNQSNMSNQLCNNNNNLQRNNGGLC